MSERATQTFQGIDMSALAGAAITAGYQSGYSSLPAWAWGDAPIWMSAQQIDRMMLDPTIRMGIRALTGPMHAAKFEVSGSAEDMVKAYALAQMRSLWSHAGKIVRAVVWGWAPNEVLYSRDADTGMVSISGLKDIHPWDAFVLTYGGRYAGIDVDGNADLPNSQKDGRPTLPGVTGLWVTHDAQFGGWYGRSRLRGAWRAWEALNRRADGLYASQTLAGYKYAYRGETAHVIGINQKFTDGPYSGRYYGDVVRQQLESKRNGAVAVMPRDKDGRRIVEIDPPDVMNEPKVLEGAIRKMEDLILMSLGVPPEVIRAADTGSGYSGRSIPMMVLYDAINEILSEIVSQCVERLIIPLTELAFGPVDIKLTVKRLEVPADSDKIKSESDTSMVSGQPAAGDGGGMADRIARQTSMSLSLAAAQRDVKAGRVTEAQAVRRVAWELDLSESRAANLLDLAVERASDA